MDGPAAVAEAPADAADRRLLVLYGSQTGTAQDLAEDVGRKARRRGFRPVAVQALDEYDVTALPAERRLVLVASTTGDAEEPDNMRHTWRFLLRRSLGPDSLRLLRFAVFGLGDSSYPKFNAVARRLQTRLKQLGAAPFAVVGLGDDQSPRGVLGDFDEWCKAMWPALHALVPSLPAPSGDEIDKPELEPLAFACRVEKAAAAGEGNGHGHADDGNGWEESTMDDVPAFYLKPAEARNGAARPFHARLLANERLTPADWFQETRHYAWDIAGLEGQSLSSSAASSGNDGVYRAGDVAYVYPENPPDGVAAALALLGLGAGDVLHLTSVGGAEEDGGGDGGGVGGLDLPARCTAGRLVRRYLDVMAVPKRHVLEQLALLAASEEEREKLLELASPEGADLYHEYCYREKRPLVEVLQDFPSTRPALRANLARFLSLCPRIRPRAFSIASSCHPDGPSPQQLHLCVAVVGFRTPYKRQRLGLCSSYLAGLPPGSRVPLWIRPGSFLLPPDPFTPLIMVGPGTGVAPFKAMVEERTAQRKRLLLLQAQAPSSSQSPPYEWLFFGCRKEQADFYYREELEGYTAWEAGEGRGLRLVTAFSRDQEQKVYVTHRIREHGAALWPLLAKQGASVFVAGSAKRMPSDVMDAVKGLAVAHGGMEEAEAAKFVDRLVRQRRYCVESWSV